jgi:hypothetical protein
MRTAALLAWLAGCSEYAVYPQVHVDDLTCATPEPDPYAPGILASCASKPEVGLFDPVVEWQWTDNLIHPTFDQIMATPVVANLTDDNGDGAIDAADTPDMVFAAFSCPEYGSTGALVALSGDDGRTLWSIMDAGGYAPYGSSGVAIADLRGDGRPSILVGSPSGLLCVDAAGRFEWLAPVPTNAYGNPAVGDIDGDGSAEVAFGASVVDAHGAVLWTGALGVGGSAFGSFLVDLDGDGPQELVAGRTVYESDGTVRWDDVAFDGWPAVADLDDDGRPEIVRVGSGYVRANDAHGNILWDYLLEDGGGGGPPTIADFDGDGSAEIGVASREYYRVLEGDGSERWRNVVQDYSSAVTGSSVFDFEGDGAAEVVYADEEVLWVYDGATGAVELAYDAHSSWTLFEYPLVVDIDGDGAAEIALASNDCNYTGSRGITILGDRTDSWAAARPVWNQHAYFISNVDDDGRIPYGEAPNWSSWNSFRAGNSETAVGLGRPDLGLGAAVYCTDECRTDVVEMWLPVENRGEVGSASVDVALYGRHGSDLVLTQIARAAAVSTGATTWVGPVLVHGEDFGEGMLVRVDDDGSGGDDGRGGGAVPECDESNNTWEWTDWPCDL